MRKLAEIVSMVAGVAALALAMAVPAGAVPPDNGYYNKMVATHTGMCAAVGNNSSSPGPPGPRRPSSAPRPPTCRCPPARSG